MNNLYSKSIAAVLIVFVCIILNGCPLLGTGTLSSRPSHPIGEVISPRFPSWGADAFPSIACRTDNITLKWDVGDPLCHTGSGPRCQTLAVEYNLSSTNPFFTSTELAGETSVGSVASTGSRTSESPTFTFSVTHNAANSDLIGWDDRISQVLLLRSGNTLREPYYPGSACNERCKWKLDEYRLDMKDQTFINSTRGLGGCVRITSICYNPDTVLVPGEQTPEKIVIDIIEDGVSRRLGEFDRGDCMEDIYLSPDLLYVVSPVLDPGMAFDLLPIVQESSQCCDLEDITEGIEITPQPVIELRFRLRCDTDSDECRTGD